jgi:hypothetical protein
MIRPGLTLALWVAIAILVIANNAIGDTWIASSMSASAVDWFKVLVPLPYVVLMAVIHARRTKGPRWLDGALLAALLWPTSTAILDFLYGRVTFGDDVDAFLGRLAVQWGAPYPLLLLALFAAPLVMGWIAARGSRSP